MHLMTYHQAYWDESAGKRIGRSKEMFVWHSERAALLDPARREAGTPGWTADVDRGMVLWNSLDA